MYYGNKINLIEVLQFNRLKSKREVALSWWGFTKIKKSVKIKERLERCNKFAYLTAKKNLRLI
jgi:hypothetical protein